MSSSKRDAQTYIFVPSSPFTTSVVPLDAAADAAPFARATIAFDAFAPGLVRTVLTRCTDPGAVLGEFECVSASLSVAGAVAHAGDRTGMASEISSVTVGDVVKRMIDVLDARGCSKYRVCRFDRMRLARLRC
jgi:hypothetical protein